MSKVIYLSYQASEGVMTSLGMDVRTIEKDADFLTILRQFKRQRISLIFVSEEVYQAEAAVIRQYDKAFDLTISVLPNQLNQRNQGEKRLNQMIEEAIGIKVG